MKKLVKIQNASRVHSAPMGALCARGALLLLGCLLNPAAWAHRDPGHQSGKYCRHGGELSSHRMHGKKDMHGKKRKHGGFQRMDRNADGRIDEGEMLHMAQRHFARMDRNGDGRLAGDEFRTRSRFVRLELKRLRDTVDRDADGTLSRAEMIEGMRERRREMDSDGDGFLTRSEMHGYRKLQHFQALDRDGDDRLSREEFLGGRGPGGETRPGQ